MSQLYATSEEQMTIGLIVYGQNFFADHINNIVKTKARTCQN